MAKPLQTHFEDVPAPMIDLAKRRTEALFRHMQYGDTPMRMILASAYMQGMNDMVDTLDHAGMLVLSDGERT